MDDGVDARDVGGEPARVVLLPVESAVSTTREKSVGFQWYVQIILSFLSISLLCGFQQREVHQACVLKDLFPPFSDFELDVKRTGLNLRC